MATRQRKGSASGQILLRVTLSYPLHGGSYAGSRSPRLDDRGFWINVADIVRFLGIRSKAFTHLPGDTPATAPTFQENVEPRQPPARRFHRLGQLCPKSQF